MRIRKSVAVFLLVFSSYVFNAGASNGNIYIDKLNRFKITMETDWVIMDPATKTIAFAVGLPKQNIELIIDIQKLKPAPQSSQQFVDKFTKEDAQESIQGLKNIKFINYQKAKFNNIPAVNVTQIHVYYYGVNAQEFYANMYMFSIKDNLYTVNFRASVDRYTITELKNESAKIIERIKLTQ